LTPVMVLYCDSLLSSFLIAFVPSPSTIEEAVVCLVIAVDFSYPTLEQGVCFQLAPYVHFGGPPSWRRFLFRSSVFLAFWPEES